MIRRNIVRVNSPCACTPARHEWRATSEAHRRAVLRVATNPLRAILIRHGVWTKPEVPRHAQPVHDRRPPAGDSAPSQHTQHAASGGAPRVTVANASHGAPIASPLSQPDGSERVEAVSGDDDRRPSGSTQPAGGDGAGKVCPLPWQPLRGSIGMRRQRGGKPACNAKRCVTVCGSGRVTGALEAIAAACTRRRRRGCKSEQITARAEHLGVETVA